MKEKWIRRTVVTILVLGTLIALFYAEENWRGARAWKQVEAELIAKGEPLTIAEIVPPEVPDDQNTAMAPVWQEIFSAHELRKKNIDSPAPRIEKLKMDTSIQKSSIRKSETLDLKAWASHLGAAEKGAADAAVLNGLENYFAERKALATEVSDALRLPYKRWPLHYEDGVYMAFPHWGATLDVVHFYQLRGIFNLRKGNERQAYEDLESIWLLADCYQPEFNMMGSLVEVTLQGFSWPVIWEGLVEHRWSPINLAKIKGVLLQQEKRNLMFTGLRGERVVFLNFLANLSAKDLLLAVSMSDTGAPAGNQSSPILFKIYAYLRPQGWVDFDKVLYAEALQKGIDWQEELMRKGTLSSSLNGMEGMFGLGHLTEWQRFQMPLSNLALPALEGSAKKSAEVLAYQRMALIACSIEQYRMTTGSIPLSLNELVPTYLSSVPLDVVDGQPVRYLRKGGDDYVLYSVGINGKDEGGINTKDKQAGDWVWPSRPGLLPSPEK